MAGFYELKIDFGDDDGMMIGFFFLKNVFVQGTCVFFCFC